MQGELVSLWQRAGFTALMVTHHVEEALFLAGRVIVLSERPAHMKAEIVNPVSGGTESSRTRRWRGESRANPSLKWRFWRLGTTAFRGLYG